MKINNDDKSQRNKKQKRKNRKTRREKINERNQRERKTNTELQKNYEKGRTTKLQIQNYRIIKINKKKRL